MGMFCFQSFYFHYLVFWKDIDVAFYHNCFLIKQDLVLSVNT